jgi:hypothetical protein
MAFSWRSRELSHSPHAHAPKADAQGRPVHEACYLMLLESVKLPDRLADPDDCHCYFYQWTFKSRGRRQAPSSLELLDGGNVFLFAPVIAQHIPNSQL